MDLSNIDVVLTDKALSVSSTTSFVDDPKAGGQAIFVGTVRNHAHGKEVIKLEFEAYQPMAIKEMFAIAAKALVERPCIKIAIHHRVGTLEIGEIAVIIAVSAAHRDAAFEACRYCIDTLKETVPIWKREYYDDGDTWVAAHP